MNIYDSAGERRVRRCHLGDYFLKSISNYFGKMLTNFQIVEEEEELDSEQRAGSEPGRSRGNSRDNSSQGKVGGQ